MLLRILRYEAVLLAILCSVYGAYCLLKSSALKELLSESKAERTQQSEQPSEVRAWVTKILQQHTFPPPPVLKDGIGDFTHYMDSWTADEAERYATRAVYSALLGVAVTNVALVLALLSPASFRRAPQPKGPKPRSKEFPKVHSRASTIASKSQDEVIVSGAVHLLLKLLECSLLRPAQKFSALRALGVLKAYPNIPEGTSIRIDLVSPVRHFGEREIKHTWTVEIERSGWVCIKSGGHLYTKRLGGDSFSAMTWTHSPGKEPDFIDYLDELGMIDDAMPFEREVEALDLSEPGYKIYLEDDDNLLLVDLEEEPDEPDTAEGDQDTVAPNGLTESESRLFAESGADREVGDAHANPPNACDICGCDLSGRKLFVDARLRGQLQWGNLCSDCFFEHGEGIGRGSGQLFYQVDSGRWVMVGGFPPEDQ